MAPTNLLDDFHPRKVRIYRNGDEFFMGKRILINDRIYGNFEQVRAANASFCMAFRKRSRSMEGLFGVCII